MYTVFEVEVIMKDASKLFERDMRRVGYGVFAIVVTIFYGIFSLGRIFQWKKQRK